GRASLVWSSRRSNTSRAPELSTQATRRLNRDSGAAADRREAEHHPEWMMLGEGSDRETPFTRSARRQRRTEAGNSQGGERELGTAVGANRRTVRARRCPVHEQAGKHDLARLGGIDGLLCRPAPAR